MLSEKVKNDMVTDHEMRMEALRLSEENDKLRAAIDAQSRDAKHTREALQALYNEVAGAWSAFEPALRLDIGHTNYNCVQLRIMGAKLVLAAVQGRETRGFPPLATGSTCDATAATAHGRSTDSYDD